MKIRFPFIVALVFVCSLAISVAAVESVPSPTGPQPPPWWMQIEETIHHIERIITLVSVLGALLITAGVGLYVKFKTEITDAKERLNRQSIDRQALQAQVTDLAKQIPPPAAPPVSVTVLDQQQPLDTGSVLG